MSRLDLCPGETVLWQGQPGWRAVARSIFHIRIVALYFALLLIAEAAADRWYGLSAIETLADEVPLVGLATGSCALILLLAWQTARTTAYALTDRRVVLRFGIALPTTLSLPLRTIGSVGVRVFDDHSGDIPLALRHGERVSFLKLWPLVRAWPLFSAQPMLRAVPLAGAVAALLRRTLASAQQRALAGLNVEGNGANSRPAQARQEALDKVS